MDRTEVLKCFYKSYSLNYYDESTSGQPVTFQINKFIFFSIFIQHYIVKLWKPYTSEWWLFYQANNW